MLDSCRDLGRLRSVKIWHDKACLRHFTLRFPSTTSAPRAHSTDACSGVRRDAAPPSGSTSISSATSWSRISTRRAGALHFNEVDGKDVPVPHFGVVLEWEDWHELAARLRDGDTRFVIEPGIRFRGEVGEQATFFLYDPSGNALEFKAFKDPSRLFAK